MSSRSDSTGWIWSRGYDRMERAESLRRQFFRLTEARDTLATWEPPVDVYEDEHEIVIVVAMPGVIAERIQVTGEAGTLIVRGQRPFPLAGSTHFVRRLEIPHGCFERRIALPPGRLELDLPEVVQGCLILRLRKLGQVS
jgi:HSP20 family molecular chaperone IbpA